MPRQTDSARLTLAPDTRAASFVRSRFLLNKGSSACSLWPAGASTFEFAAFSKASMNSISLEISPVSAPPALEPPAEAGPADAPASGFGQVFAGLASGLPQGQSLAAATHASTSAPATEAAAAPLEEASVLSTDAWLSGAGAASALTLQTVDLGPSMRLITPASAPPDADSLAAFAKAQGLGEAAVHWLLGASAGAPAGAAASSLDAAPLAASLGLAAPAWPGWPGMKAAHWMGQPPEQAAQAAQAHPTGDELAAMVAAASRGVVWQRGLAGAGTPAGPAGTPSAAGSPAPVEVLLDLNMDLSDLPDVPPGLDAPDALPALQAWLDGEAAPADADAGATPAPASGPGADLLGRPGGAPTSLGAERAGPALDLNQRSEQYQVLAQRLGEAMAHRLMAQVERGHWNVRFMLRPQSLGQVEVELRMRSGEMDAVFKTPHALTRELINDGLPRLRELLSQMGMDVAQIHVGTGQSQKNGGNPTPRQAPPGAEGVALKGSAEVGSPASQPRQTGGADGWDVLV